MNWLTFVNDIFLGDEELMQTMQLILGYAFTGDKTADIVVVAQGPGRNGKSLFFKTIKEISARRPYEKEPEVFRNSATPFYVFIKFPAFFIPGPPKAPNEKTAIRSDFILGDLLRDKAAIWHWIDEGTNLYRRFRFSGLKLNRKSWCGGAFMSAERACRVCRHLLVVDYVPEVWIKKGLLEFVKVVNCEHNDIPAVAGQANP
jgi:hypothetical protein